MDCAARITNAVIASDQITAGKVTTELLRHLDDLETKYGRAASILATRADYTSDPQRKVQLFEEAYQRAKTMEDKVNMTYVASSLAQVFIDDIEDLTLGEKWLAHLADSLGDSWDDYEHKEYKELSGKLQQLRRSG